MMSSSYTHTLLESRLQPLNQRIAATYNGKTLLRSSSFHKLREFPAYLCRKGSSDVVQWAYTSRTRLSCIISTHHKQARRYMLLLSVYAAVSLLAVQTALLAGIFLTANLPIGLIFLSACVITMATLANFLIRSHLSIQRPLPKAKTV